MTSARSSPTTPTPAPDADATDPSDGRPVSRAALAFAAFTIMSEPLGLSLYWTGLYALTRAAQSSRPRWYSILPGVLLLIAAMESRIATLGTVPGLLLALWLTTRRAPSPHGTPGGEGRG